VPGCGAFGQRRGLVESLGDRGPHLSFGAQRGERGGADAGVLAAEQVDGFGRPRQQLGVKVKLTWNAPASNGAAVTDYVIESSANGGTTWTTVNDGVSSATTSMVSGLTNGTQYSFRVAGKNAAGSGASSPTVLATPLGAPGTPSGLTAAVAPAGGVGSGQVKLTWNPSASNGVAIPTTSSSHRLTGRRGPRSTTACPQRRRTP
jgi:Fibronectin type III domain